MKKIMRVAFVAAFAAIAGYGIYTNQKVDTMSDLILANVEALASGEGGSSDCDTYCTPDDRCTCIIRYAGEVQGITCDNSRGK